MLRFWLFLHALMCLYVKTVPLRLVCSLGVKYYNMLSLIFLLWCFFPFCDRHCFCLVKSSQFLVSRLKFSIIIELFGRILRFYSPSSFIFYELLFGVRFFPFLCSFTVLPPFFVLFLTCFREGCLTSSAPLFLFLYIDVATLLPAGLFFCLHTSLSYNFMRSCLSISVIASRHFRFGVLSVCRWRSNSYSH